jgi:4'-phosphopantetheinyl transferase
MNGLFPNNMFQKTVFPQSGIHVRYIKIPDMVDLIFQTPLDPDYKKMPNLLFGPKDFKILFLSAQELALVNGFKAQKKQIEWLCGRFSLKTLVNEILNPDTPLDTPLSNIQVSYHEKGAPFLNAYPDIPISLSHSNKYTAAALCCDSRMTMGIDIEQIGKMPDLFFMKTAFTEREIRHMDLTPHEIYRHWTLKEAFLKYIKMGFNENLHRVEVIDNEIFHHGRKQRLNSWSRTIDDRYILSMVADPILPQSKENPTPNRGQRYTPLTAGS